MSVYANAHIYSFILFKKDRCGCHLYTLPLPLKRSGKSRFKDYVAILI